MRTLLILVNRPNAVLPVNMNQMEMYCKIKGYREQMALSLSNACGVHTQSPRAEVHTASAYAEVRLAGSTLELLCI